MVYVLSTILSAAIPFALLPVLTRYLSPAEYGQVAMYSIFVNALGALIGLSVHGSANRRFFDDKVTVFELSRFNGNCFFVLMITTCLALLSVFFLDSYLSDFLGIPIIWTYFGVLSVFFGFVLNIRLGQWQIRGEAKLYGILQVSNAAIIFFFSLIFVIFFKLGAEGRIYGMVLSSLIIGFLSYLTLRNDKVVLLKYNREDMSYILSFGMPLIPHVFGGFLLLSVDRLLINKELGLEMAGIYMVAVSLGSALNLLFNSINKAYSPWLFSQLKKNNMSKKISIVRKTYVYFIFLMLITVVAYFISPLVLRFVVGEEFYQAAAVLPIVILGQVFFGMYLMVTNYIFYVKKTKYLSIVTIFSGVINILFLLFLIPIYGIFGAALAFMAANFIRFIGTWIVSARVFSMPWFFWKF